jgi:hypothetical protein
MRSGSKSVRMLHHPPLETVESANPTATRSARRLRQLAALMAYPAALLALTASAQADTLTVSAVHPSRASGAIVATITATAPADSAIALDLYRQACPQRPRQSDFVPGVITEGEAVELLANPPAPGVTGRFQLCIWIQHDDGEIGARFEATVVMPPMRVSHPSPRRHTRQHRHRRCAR